MKFNRDITNTDFNFAEISTMKVDDFIAQHKNDFFTEIADEKQRADKLKELHAACVAEKKKADAAKK